jgi:hypothetical protein
MDIRILQWFSQVTKRDMVCRLQNLYHCFCRCMCREINNKPYITKKEGGGGGGITIRKKKNWPTRFERMSE